MAASSLRSCALHDALTRGDVEVIVEEVSRVGAHCLMQARETGLLSTLVCRRERRVSSSARGTRMLW